MKCRTGFRCDHLTFVLPDCHSFRNEDVLIWKLLFCDIHLSVTTTDQTIVLYVSEYTLKEISYGLNGKVDQFSDGNVEPLTFSTMERMGEFSFSCWEELQ